MRKDEHSLSPQRFRHHRSSSLAPFLGRSRGNTASSGATTMTVVDPQPLSLEDIDPSVFPDDPVPGERDRLVSFVFGSSQQSLISPTEEPFQPRHQSSLISPSTPQRHRRSLSLSIELPANASISSNSSSSALIRPSVESKGDALHNIRSRASDVKHQQPPQAVVLLPMNVDDASNDTNREPSHGESSHDWLHPVSNSALGTTREITTVLIVGGEVETMSTIESVDSREPVDKSDTDSMSSLGTLVSPTIWGAQRQSD